ncbi:hypothetical protein Tco_0269965 [Tanacetum coccineum]
MSIEEMRHEQQLVDYKIKEITNDLGYKRFRGEKIDEEYEEDCEIRIRNYRINVESDLVESLINCDTSIIHSSKIDPILEKFTGEPAHIAPIPPGIVEADPDDDTSSDDDDFEDVDCVSFEEVNDVEQEEKEFDLEDIFQIQDVFPSVRKVSKRASYSDLDSEGDIIFLDNLLNEDPIPEYERFTFDIEPDAPVINNFDELNEDECFDPGGGEIDVEDDDSFTFVIRTFLPFLTYPADSPLLLSTGSEDTIFDPGIST